MLRFLISLLILSHVTESLDVKLGFMFPHDSVLRGYLTNKIGFSTTAGAVAVAVERIEKENILPGANISVAWRFSQCDESIASGLSVELFRAGEVDVMIGPPCAVRYLTGKIGFSTSAGAVAVAVERIEKEGLLPGANISVAWRYSQCDESVASGLSLELFRSGEVDVMIGPPCAVLLAEVYLTGKIGFSTSAGAVGVAVEWIEKEQILPGPTYPCAMVGVFANYYNVPQISWAATSLELADPTRYPSLSRVIGSAIRIGRAMKELLLYFDWTRVALFYTDDMGARKCLSVAQGANFHFPKAGIHIVYFQEVPREIPTDAEIDKFFTHFPKQTRIAIICIDVDSDIRRFMMRAQQRGCSGEEFVYLLPDYVRFENQSDVWTDRAEGVSTSGRDVEARGAMQNALFMEMMLSSNEELFVFKKKVAESIKGWPFYYKVAKTDEKYGSLYSPFLHDSVYLYALALNKTLEQGGNKTDGLMITDNVKNIHFQGVSGHVVMDDVAGREPTFVIKGFTRDGKQTVLMKAEMYKTSGQTISLLVPEYAMWETRGGYVPKWYPRCGWLGEKCQEEVDSFIPIVIAAAVVGSILLTLGIIGGFFYYRNKILVDEMALMLWKISPKDVKKLVDMQTDGSLTTITTDASEDVAEIVLKGSERAAHFRNQLVWLKYHQVSMVLSSKQDHMQMKTLRDLAHENLNLFFGLCLEGSQPMSVWKYCNKGSLQDVLYNSQLKLDWYFKYSLIRDFVGAMDYLHESGINTHGSLKSTNCLVNSRWVLLVTDFGLAALKQGAEKQTQDMLWTAPEILRNPNPPLAGTQAGDVYSFSIILGEIITRDMPYASYNKLPQEIVNLVRAGLAPPFRPDIQNQNDADMDPAMTTLMRDCWFEDPKLRPDFKHIKSAVKQMNRGREGSLLDHAMKMMERYSNTMEQTITDRTKMLTDETTKADDLLYKFLPRHVAIKLKNAQTSEPESYDSITLVFTSIADFDKIAEKSNPVQIVNLLSDITYQMDEIIDEYEAAYRVQTINDKYMIACGLDPKAARTMTGSPAPNSRAQSAATTMTNVTATEYNGNLHHTCIGANMGLHFGLRLGRYYMAHLPNMKCQLQIGIHTGSVIAGVLGTLTPKYMLFGESVSTGQMMMEQGKSGCIHISENTNGYLTDIIGGYITKPRGEMQVHGSGTIFTYWLLGKKTKQIDDKTQSTSSGDSGSRSRDDKNNSGKLV